MEKLELKHLAPYLPYGLKVKDIAYSATFGLSLTNIILPLKDNEYYKPTLRPLSDLNESEIDNIYTLFIDNRHDIEREWIEINVNMLKTEHFSIKWAIDLMPYLLMEYLYEHHYDVFGLIEKGLAIDINTLTQ